MTVETGVVEAGEIILGHDLYLQTFTITGGATSGTMTFSMLDETTAPVNITDSASTIQAAIQLLSYPCAQSATFAWTSGTVFTLTSGSAGAFVEPWRVTYSLTGGTDPEITRALTSRKPLFYTIGGETTYGQASVPPTVGKQAVPGTVADRTDQSKASEWFGRSWLPGLGRLHYRENESVERFWDSNCWTHVDRQITLPALVESETMAASAGTPYGVTNYKVGVTLNGGVRAVGMFDVTGLATSGNPVYYDASIQTWQIIPGASTLSSDTAICGIIFYGGYVYMSYTNASQTKRGYLSWDGASGTNATTIDTTDQIVVLDFEEWDGKVFRLLTNGKLQWASVSSGAIAEADWVPTTNTPTYKGPGYAYALKNFTDRSGALILHIIATDGLYQFDFENWRIVRVKEVNGPSVLAPGVYPQPNSVTEHNGDLYWIHGDTVRKYDGSIISDIGPAIDDGLPEKGLAFWTALRPRALFSTNNMLFCAMSKPVENVASTTIAADTTVATQTTYYTTLTVSSTYTLTVNADVTVTNPIDDLGCVLGFNGQGWHSIVPLTQGTTASPFTSRAILYHELHNVPRLIFAPGKFIRWRDKPSNPLFWSDMKWDTSAARYFTTSWFDLDLTDIVKLLLYLRVGYKSAGPGSTITPYFQTNGVADNPNISVGNDPEVHLVQLFDGDGSLVVIGNTDDPGTGVEKAFFERDTSPTIWSRGFQAREVRLTFKFTTTDSSSSPYLDFFALPLTAEFNSLFSFPLSIQITAQGEKDGRSAQRQFNDLMATYLTKHVVELSVRPDAYIPVSMDFFNIQGLSTGTDIANSRLPQLGVTLSEITRF